MQHHHGWTHAENAGLTTTTTRDVGTKRRSACQFNYGNTPLKHKKEEVPVGASCPPICFLSLTLSRSLAALAALAPTYLAPCAQPQTSGPF